MVAVAVATNHKCIDKGSKNCSVKSGCRKLDPNVRQRLIIHQGMLVSVL